MSHLSVAARPRDRVAAPFPPEGSTQRTARHGSSGGFQRGEGVRTRLAAILEVRPPDTRHGAQPLDQPAGATFLLPDELGLPPDGRLAPLTAHSGLSARGPRRATAWWPPARRWSV